MSAEQPGKSSITCANCGRELGAGASRCLYCSAIQGRQCPTCKSIVPVGAQVCFVCKRNIPLETPNYVLRITSAGDTTRSVPTSVVPSDKDASTRQSKFGFAKVGLFLVLLLIAGGAVGWYFMSLRKSSPVPSPEPSQVSPREPVAVPKPPPVMPVPPVADATEEPTPVSPPVADSTEEPKAPEEEFPKYDEPLVQKSNFPTATVRVGELTYIGRDYSFKVVPKQIDGATYLGRNVGIEIFTWLLPGEVTVSRPCNVYVAILWTLNNTVPVRDEQFATLAANGWEILPYPFVTTITETSIGRVEWKLIRRSIDAGPVNLENCASIEGAHMIFMFSETPMPPQSSINLDLDGGMKMELVYIPPGEFMMGSSVNEDGRLGHEGPQHRVRISRGFYMGTTEVTQAQYETVMGNNPSHFKGANNPVEEVSWDNAVEFCKRLSEKTGGTVRLPSEAEWEYACRAGTITSFHTGETISMDQANYNSNGVYGNGQGATYQQKTMPVGSFPVNAFGLYDMHGNVFEYCADWYDKDYYRNSPPEDPSGPVNGQYRVLRGGSWGSNPRNCRSAFRTKLEPAGRDSSYGFRVVYEFDAINPVSAPTADDIPE